MSFVIEVKEIAAQPTAVVRGLTTAANLRKRIRALFDEFYAGFKGKGGLNIIFYPEWDEDGEFHIECGVLVEGGGNSSLPAGRVATTVHIRPYDQMKSAHHAIHQWVRENGHKIAGPSWEVYGHWSDDPAKLRTDIFYLLRGGGS